MGYRKQAEKEHSMKEAKKSFWSKIKDWSYENSLLIIPSIIGIGFILSMVFAASYDAKHDAKHNALCKAGCAPNYALFCGEIAEGLKVYSCIDANGNRHDKYIEVK